MDSSIKDLRPEDGRVAPAAGIPDAHTPGAVGDPQQAPGREREVEQQAEHLGAPAPCGGVEDVGDPELALPEHHERVPAEELVEEGQVARGGGGVEEPAAVAGAEEGVSAAGGVLALEEEAARDAGAAPRGVDEAGVVVPDGLQAADAAEGGELDDEVGVDVEELADEVVVAVGGGPVDRRGVPPLVPRALPPEREIGRRHWDFARGGGCVCKEREEQVEEEKGLGVLLEEKKRNHLR